MQNLPRGLRNLKQCGFLDRDLLKEWSHISEFCTTKWMDIIIQQRERKFLALKEKNQFLCMDICKIVPHLLYTWLLMLKRNSIRREDDLICNNLSKFRRGLDNYNLNRVFV